MMIAWHVYPLGFLGAPIRPGEAPPLVHRLPHLIDWLDYATDLGCDALSLGPVFASVSHGYDTLDYLRIDPRLGDDDDFDALIRAAHERGVRVFLDGVFNHASARHPDERLFARDERGPRPFEGHGDLIEWDHSHPEVVQRTAQIMNHWLGRGADGWRLDAAYATGPHFWARVIPQVRQQHPQAYVFAEMIHGDYASFVATSGVDSVTQYELWKAIWSSLVDVNFFELRWTLQRHAALLDTFAPVTFIGNHDVERIASRVGPALVPLALAVIMTVGGEPHLYYGDEQGFTGVKAEGFAADDPLRVAFPDRPADLGEAGRGLLDVHRQLTRLRRAHPWLERARTRLDQVATDRLAYTSFDRADEARSLRVTLDRRDRAHPSCRIEDTSGTALFDYRA